MKKIPVIAVVGPTASGKTSLSINIAKKFSGQVVSADSMQIYEKMDIATAKPTAEEMRHFLDCVETGTAPETSPEESLEGLEIIWKLYEAEEKGVIAHF